MHVIVVGCGRVGSGLATELDREGHSVAIVDKTPSAFRRLPPGWNGQKVIGFGFDRAHLDEAGAGRADALAAVTSGDNSNILTARIARETYEIPNVVARIYDPRRAEIFERLGIPTVPSVGWTIEQVFRRILPDLGAFDWTDSSGRLHLFELVIPPAWAGRRLVESVAEAGEDGVRLVGVTRRTSPILDVSELIGQESDVLHIMVTSDALAEFRRVAGRDATPKAMADGLEERSRARPSDAHSGTAKRWRR
ncbi:MAG: potassium channel family protein [Acidimicrobiales bacterium]